MSYKVIPCYPTHGEGHSAFYEGYYRNDDLPRFPICKDLLCGIWYMVYGISISWGKWYFCGIDLLPGVYGISI